MNRKDRAIKLRTEGYTYSYIAEKTGLAKSTLSYHLANVPYSPNKETIKVLSLAQLRSAKTKHTQKQSRITDARRQAIKEFGTLSNRDVFIAGIALYAGEGSKTQNLVRLVNADPNVICFFIKWLNQLGVNSNHIMLRVHGYPDTDKVEAESYWLEKTGLDKTQLQPMCIDIRVGKDRKRSGVHKYGTAHVTVKANGNPEFGTALARKIAIYMKLLLG
jgi:hypothetical protein